MSLAIVSARRFGNGFIRDRVLVTAGLGCAAAAGLGWSIISSSRASQLFQSCFAVGVSSGVGGEGARPGCLAVNDLDSKECSEQEQKGSRECSSADGR